MLGGSQREPGLCGFAAVPAQRPAGLQAFINLLYCVIIEDIERDQRIMEKDIERDQRRTEDTCGQIEQKGQGVGNLRVGVF